MSAPVVVRICGEPDLAALEWDGEFRHHRQIFRQAYDMQLAGEAVMLLAESEGRCLGQAWLDLTRDPPMVWAVRVQPQAQRSGVGARLMGALEQEARRRGHARLTLGVETDNPGARRFYEALGWRVSGERTERYGYVTPEGQMIRHDLREWLMEKEII